MIKRVFICFLSLIATICFTGCKDGNNPVPGIDEWKGRELNDNPTILVQECNFLFLSSYKKNEDGSFWQIADNTSEIESDTYALKFSVIGYSYDSINPNSFDITKQCSRPSDPIIDKHLLEQQFKIPWGYYLEYRLEEVKAIKIWSDYALFGRNAGNDISDKFVFNGCTSGILPWITEGPKYKGLIPNGTTISEYLSTKPFIFAEAFFLMSEKPVEISNNLKCSFTASIELQNGKVLQATTQPVSLR